LEHHVENRKLSSDGLAAAKFYFQQQVTAGAACLAASKTFALGD